MNSEYQTPPSRPSCIVTINVLWLFLTVPWAGLPYVIVVFHDHTHLRFGVALKQLCLCVGHL